MIDYANPVYNVQTVCEEGSISDHEVAHLEFEQTFVVILQECAMKKLMAKFQDVK